MTTSLQGGSTVDLVPLGETTWRVCDTTFDEGDARRVIGYVQELDDGFEMMWMRPRPGVCYRYPTLDDAVRAVTLRLGST